MRQTLAWLAIGMMVAAMLPAQISARGFHRGARHHQRSAVTESAGCDLGWWQTLRFGHVHPRWGISCRR